MEGNIDDVVARIARALGDPPPQETAAQPQHERPIPSVISYSEQRHLFALVEQAKSFHSAAKLREFYNDLPNVDFPSERARDDFYEWIDTYVYEFFVGQLQKDLQKRNFAELRAEVVLFDFANPAMRERILDIIAASEGRFNI